MNRNYTRQLASAVLFLTIILGARCLFGQTALPTNWWQGMPPEALWKKAETITSELAFLRGIKAQLKTDPNSGFEHLQRRTADGFVETKIISRNNKNGQQQVVYQNKEGHWLVISAGLMAGFIAKLEFGENADTEKRIAKSIQQPYAYRLLNPVVVGTNACIVVSRTMTVPMFEAFLEDCIKHLKPDLVKAMLIDGTRPDDNVCFEKQCFIRQLDGVVMGCLDRNKSGGLKADRLNDIIWVNQTIPDGEFSVPKSTNNVAAKSAEEFRKIFIKDLEKEISKASKTRERKNIFMRASMALGILALVMVSMIRLYRRGTRH